MSSSLYAQLPNLSTGQRNLLLAALASNKRGRVNGNTGLASGTGDIYTPNKTAQVSPVDAVNPAIYDLTQESFPAAGYDSTFDDSLLSSYGEAGAFDFGSAGSAFAVQNNAENEHEKRKSPDDEEEDDEDDDTHNKRQEGDDKVAKKPGRKLIVAEPTTVSVARCLADSNRALTLCRNGKPRIARLSEHSVIGRKSISKVSSWSCAKQ